MDQSEKVSHEELVAVLSPPTKAGQPPMPASAELHEVIPSMHQLLLSCLRFAGLAGIPLHPTECICGPSMLISTNVKKWLQQLSFRVPELLACQWWDQLESEDLRLTCLCTACPAGSAPMQANASSASESVVSLMAKPGATVTSALSLEPWFGRKSHGLGGCAVTSMSLTTSAGMPVQ